MANSKSSSSKSNFELYQDVVVNFEKNIDLSTADNNIIRKYVRYKFLIYKDNNI